MNIFITPNTYDDEWFIAQITDELNEETGEIIKRGLGFNGEIKIIPGLIERDFGLLEGKKVCKESYDLMKIGIEGLEMLPELQERALKTILDINRLFPSKKILITTHSQFIKGLL